MRNLSRSVLSVLAVISISASQGFSQDSDWVLFESPDNDFTILFPQLPKADPQLINSDIGELKLNVYMYQAADLKNEDNFVYGVMSTEYPESLFVDATDEVLKDFFRSSVDGAVANVRGKLLSETIIQLDGNPGREIKVDFRDGMAVIKMRLYLVANKMYMVQTITETRKDFNLSINRFMDSFTLKE